MVKVGVRIRAKVSEGHMMDYFENHQRTTIETTHRQLEVRVKTR
jgi:hypothetical protein